MKILGKFKPLKPEIALWLCVVELKTSQDKCMKRWVDLMKQMLVTLITQQFDFLNI